MKTKKCGFFAALTVILLVSAVLITNCVNPLDSVGLGGGRKSVSLPPGKGAIWLNLGEMRSTIYPDLDGVPVGSLYYQVELIDQATVDPANIDLANWLYGDPIEVTAGVTYVVNLFAYTITNGATTPVYTGIVGKGTGTTPVTVNSGNSEEVEVLLSPIAFDDPIYSAGTGTFLYDLTVPTGTSVAATLTIEPVGGPALVGPSATVIKDLTITKGATGNEGEVLLERGYWRATVTVAQARHQTITLPVIVHIFQNMPTEEFARTFTLTQNVFTATYYNDALDGDDDPDPAEVETLRDEDITLGLAVTPPAAADQPASAQTVTGGTLTWSGWYTTPSPVVAASYTETPYVFATRILGNLNLYARYLFVAGDTITIDVEWDDDVVNKDDPTFTGGFTGDTITQTELLTVGAIEISVATPAGFSQDLVWTHNLGAGLSGYTSGTNEGVLTLDFTDPDEVDAELHKFYVPGTHVITVEGVRGTGDDAVRYSGAYTFTVTTP